MKARYASSVQALSWRPTLKRTENRHCSVRDATSVGHMLAAWASARFCTKIFVRVTHRGCAKTEEAAKAVQEFPLLKDDIQLLRAENTSLKEELSEVRTLFASLHSALTSVEARMTSVADIVDLLQAAPSSAVSQIERGGSAGKGVRNYASVCNGNGGVAARRQRQQGPEDKLSNKSNGTGKLPRSGCPQGGREIASDSRGRQDSRQPLRDVPNSHTETPFDARGEKVPVEGKRRIWGTRKACSHSAVKHAINQLVPALKDKFQVKRKYKKSHDNIVRWWHVISGAEEDLKELQKAWEPVQVQTMWKLEPCLLYVEKVFWGEVPSPTTTT